MAAPPPETRTARLRFEFDQAQPGLEWQGIEHDPRHGTVRRSASRRRLGLAFNWIEVRG